MAKLTGVCCGFPQYFQKENTAVMLQISSLKEEMENIGLACTWLKL
jgi:hypothetical protein